MRMVSGVVASLLVAGLLTGCSGSSEESGASSSSAPAPSSAAPTSRSTTKPPVPARPPAADAPVAAVIAWVQAGAPAELAGFHTATRDQDTTDLGEGVAFVTPSGKTQCRTDPSMTSGALACLVKLAEPPAQPDEVAGQWIGNWVDFDGAAAQVGSVHGDPGPFTTGLGPELAYGSSLRFGDFQCRTDQVGLFCVNFARQSALRLSDAGVVPFGCLREVPAPADAGLRFECR